MSYDPRRGESPYLGMEVDEVPETTSAPHATTRAREGVHRTAAPEPYERTVRAGEGLRGRSATAEVPGTVRRPSGAPGRGFAPRDSASVTRSQVIRRPQAQPAPAPQPVGYAAPISAPRRSSGPAAWLGSTALVLLSWVLRAIAICLAGMVVASAVLTDSRRAMLVEVLNVASAFVPSGLSGRLVMETPFGGALRGDLIIASIILFCADWFCLVLSSSLREGRERGAY